MQLEQDKYYYVIQPGNPHMVMKGREILQLGRIMKTNSESGQVQRFFIMDKKRMIKGEICYEVMPLEKPQAGENNDRPIRLGGRDFGGLK